MSNYFEDLNPLEHRFQGENSLRTLLYLYRGERGKLLRGIVLYIVKHSPVWLMPLLTANIINIIAQPEQHSTSELWLNALVLALLLFQNVPLHYLYVRSVSQAARRLETQLRSAICRRLQHLSIGFYATQSAGVLQSKVLRDVESIEQLTRTLFDAGLSALVNITFALIVTALRVPWFLIFYVLTVPIAAGLVYALRSSLSARNSAFRQEIEQMSSRVIEMTHLIPITRAHGLESNALERVDQSLQRVQRAGLQVDEINAVFGALSWVTFNLFNMGCLVFAAWAYSVQFLPIQLGDVVMLTTYFGLMTNSVMILANTAPQITKGFEAIRSDRRSVECPDLEQNEEKGSSPQCAANSLSRTCRSLSKWRNTPCRVYPQRARRNDRVGGAIGCGQVDDVESCHRLRAPHAGPHPAGRPGYGDARSTHVSPLSLGRAAGIDLV
jgi:ATP-binding cassette subfamily B protein